MDTATFEWYIRQQLAPTLRPGQVVVMDNLSAHKADSIRQAIAARGCQLLFLPPYSPDFTPIEQAFSKIKAILRGLGARTKETLQEAVRARHRGHYPTRCGGLVRPCWLPSACSSYLKVALGVASPACAGVEHTRKSYLKPAGSVTPSRKEYRKNTEGYSYHVRRDGWRLVFSPESCASGLRCSRQDCPPGAASAASHTQTPEVAPPWTDLVLPLSCRGWPSDLLTDLLMVRRRWPNRVFEVGGSSVATVFICYRREDAPADDRAHLRSSRAVVWLRFGIQRSRFDPLGTDFPSHIQRILRQATAQVVVIGPRWLDIRDEAGSHGSRTPAISCGRRSRLG